MQQTWIAVSRVLPLAIAVLCLSTAAGSEDSRQNAASLQQLLEERTQRIAEFQAAQQSGRADEAITAAERVAEIERQFTGQPGPNESAELLQIRANLRNSLITTLGWLSARHEGSEQFEQAIAAQQELLALLTEQLGNDHSQVTGARVRLVELQAQAKLTPNQRAQLREANRLHEQALEAFNIGETHNALALEQQVLDTRTSILGEDAPTVAATCYDLGFLFQRTDDLERSAEYLRRAERVRRRLPGQNHPDWQQSVELLADVLGALSQQALGDERFDDADKYQSERLARLLDRYAAADWRVNQARSALDDIRVRQKLTPDQVLELRQADELHIQATRSLNEGNVEKGIELESTVLKTRQSILGVDHLEAAAHHGNLAFAFEKLGQLDLAEQHRRTQLRIQEQKLGASHPQYLENEGKLVTLLRARANQFRSDRQFSQANELLDGALTIVTARYGNEHWRTGEIRAEIAHVSALAALSAEQWQQLETARGLNAEAMTLYRAESYKEAAAKVDRALEYLRSLLGERDPETLKCQSNRAVLAEYLGDFALAEKCLRANADGRLAMLGIDHSSARAAIEDLADFLSRRAYELEDHGDFIQATDNRREVLQLRNGLFGEDHWKNTDARLALQDTQSLSKVTAEDRKKLTESKELMRKSAELRDKGRFREAAELLREYVDVRVSVLGEEPSDYPVWLNNLAEDYREAGEHSKAEPLLQKSLTVALRLAGEEHPDVAATLSNLALLYHDLSQLSKAEPLYLKSREIKKRLYGEQHPEYAHGLRSLAGLYVDLGNYAEAESLYRQSLETTRSVLGEEHQDYADCLNGLALLYLEMGKFAAAKPLFEQALELRGSGWGKEHPRYATVLGNLAVLYDNLGDYEKAVSLHLRCLKIQEATLGSDHPRYANSLSNLAESYRESGDYTKAEPLYRESLETKRKALGDAHPDLALGLNNLGLLYQEIGDYEKAKSLFESSLQIRANALGEHHPDCANSLNNLGVLHMQLGDYVEAEPLLLKALEIIKDAHGEQHSHYAFSLIGLGTLYSRMGDIAHAHAAFEKSLDILEKTLGKEHPEYARNLEHLAGLAKDAGDYRKARALYEASLEIRKRTLGETHPDFARSLNHLASLLSDLGDHVSAERLYVAGLDVFEDTLGPNHPAYAQNLNNLALLYFEVGDYERAMKSLRRSHEILATRLGEHHPNYATSLNNLAALHRAVGEFEPAFECCRKALSIHKTLLETTSAIQSERQQLAMAEDLRITLDQFLSLVIEADQWSEQVYRDALAWKGATLARQRQMRAVAEDEDIAPIFQKLQAAATRLATLSRLAPAPNQQTAWRRQLEELTAERERLESELSATSAAFRAAKKTVSLEELLAALPEGAALIDFLEYTRLVPTEERQADFNYERSLVAFVVRPGKEVELLDLGPAASLSDDIDTWRGTMGMSPQAKAAGNRLRERLWKPALPYIEGAKTVIVSPDGILGRLPLGALPGQEVGKYLIEDHRLVTVAVPQLIPELVNDHGRREFANDLLLMGDVDYDRDAETPQASARRRKPSERRRNRAAVVRSEDRLFEELTGARGEIAFIRGLYGDLYGEDGVSIALLEKTSATEARFRQLAPQCFQLHLATHGFFAAPDKRSALNASEEQRGRMFSDREHMVRGLSPGLLSGLAFAGANRTPEPDKDDGILTADEIAFLPLDGVDLAVLSACETGLGEVAGGEGLIGIQRAFQISGARTTIASLWKVPDQATRVLMERFYENYLEKEMSRLDALRDAQLWMLNNPDLVRGATSLDEEESPPRSPPPYWAAFVLSGDWR